MESLDWDVLEAPWHIPWQRPGRKSWCWTARKKRSARYAGSRNTDLQKETLRETGIQNCDIVVVCIGDKVDISILTTLNVINLGVPQVIAKANSPEQGEILEKIGAQVVYPEKDMAVRLAKRLISKRIFNLFELEQNIDISELKMTSKIAGKTVVQAQLRNLYGVNIIAISRNGWLTTDIKPEYVLDQDDTIVVIGDRDKIKRLADDL